MARIPSPTLKEKVLNQVSSIPSGMVVTYGDIANHTNLIARTVGWIMASLTDKEMELVPWHRVVGSNGTIPALKYGFRGNIQIEMLKDEQIEFTKSLKIKNYTKHRFDLDSLV